MTREADVLKEQAEREARRTRFRVAGSEARNLGVKAKWDIGVVLAPEASRVYNSLRREGEKRDDDDILEVYLEAIGHGETPTMGGLAPGCRRLGRPDGLHAEHLASHVFLHLGDD